MIPRTLSPDCTNTTIRPCWRVYYLPEELLHNRMRETTRKCRVAGASLKTLSTMMVQWRLVGTGSCLWWILVSWCICFQTKTDQLNVSAPQPKPTLKLSSRGRLRSSTEAGLVYCCENPGSRFCVQHTCRQRQSIWHSSNNLQHRTSTPIKAVTSFPSIVFTVFCLPGLSKIHWDATCSSYCHDVLMELLIYKLLLLIML